MMGSNNNLINAANAPSSAAAVAAPAMLSAGFIRAIQAGTYNNDPRFAMPVLQLLSLKKSAGGTAAQPDRWRLTVSDGDFFSVAMLATQLNALADQLNKGALIRLTHFVCNDINGKKIIIILKCELFESQTDFQKIGNPVSMSDSSAPPPQTSTSTAAPTSTTSYNPSSSRGMGMGGGMMMNSTNLNSNNQQSSSNNYNNNNNYNPASNSSDPSIFPIKSLSPYQNKWTIKARVIQKSPSVVTWKNARGEGRLFSFTLKDESGEIRVTTFNEGVDLYWDLIKENHVYLISRGSVKIVRNKQYSNVANDYEMSIDGHSSVTPCADGADVPGVEYDSAVPLDNLMNYEKDATIDVVGIVTMAGEAETLISKAQKEYRKRELKICDQTGYEVRMTLFGQHADSYSGDSDFPVIAVKGVKVSEYGGRTLSLLSSSTVQINPDIPQAHAVRGWYDATVREAGGGSFAFRSYDMGGGGGAAGGNSTIRPEDPFKYISQIKDENLGMGDKPDYLNVRGTISFVKSENIAYTACPTEGCNKKVNQEGDNAWRCEKCQKTHTHCSYRYTLNVSVIDHTGQIWVSLFNETGVQLLGKTADEMMALKDENEDAFKSQLQAINFRTFNFKLRAKVDHWNDEAKLRTSVTGMFPLVPVDECKKLADKIELYL